MPRIPTYEAKEQLDPGRAPRVQLDTSAESAAASLGQAVSGFGFTGAQVAQQWEKRQNEQATFKSGLEWEGARSDLTAAGEELQKTMPADGAGYHDAFMKKADELVNARIAKMPSPEQQDRYRAKWQTADREAWGLSAAGTQAKVQTEYSKTAIAEVQKNLTNEIATAATNFPDDRAVAEGAYKRGLEFINTAPGLLEVQKDALRKNWLEVAATVDAQTRYGKDPTALSKALGVPDPSAARASTKSSAGSASGPVGTVVDKIIGVESGGNPNAKNPNSSASGLGQFIDSTWIGMVRKYRPDLGNMERADILALKTDPAIAREMTTRYTQENASYLSSRDLPTTPGNLYLAHFLGPAGAAKVIGASSDTPVSSVVDGGAISANRSILAGKTTGQVIGWADRKMGVQVASLGTTMNDASPIGVSSSAPAARAQASPADPYYASIPYATRVKLVEHADLQRRQAEAKQASDLNQQYNEKLNSMMVGVIDNKTTLADVKTAREQGWLTDAGDINKVVSAIEKRDGNLAAIQSFGQAMSDPSFPWNPVDKDHKAMISAGFEAQGKNLNALQNIVEKTHIIPPEAGVSLRGAIVSNNPQRASAALQVATNLRKFNPSIFTGVDGGNDIETAAISFQHKVDDLGLTAQEATRQVLDERTPEYAQKVKAKIKGEDLDKVVKDNLLPKDLSKAFDEGVPLGPRPDVEATPEGRKIMMGDYEELFRSSFMRSGDVAQAKLEAISQLKTVWGVSYVNGSMGGTLMRYPPDRAKAFAGIADPGAALAAQAIEKIKADTGVVVDRSKIIIAPVPETVGPYKAGEPPPFRINYFDAKGHFQMGKDLFVPDVTKMRQAQTEARRRELERLHDLATIPPEQTGMPQP